MKIRLLTISLLSGICLFGQTSSAMQDEVSLLLSLVDATKQSLQEQQKVLKLVIEYRKAREVFFEETSSAKFATRLVKAASTAYFEIEKNHLTHLFSEDFLSEIRFYTQIALENTPKEFS